MTDAILQAAAVLRSGGVVAFPTETVYGLGGDAANPAAVARIFQVKRRPPGQPLSLLLGRVRDPARFAAWTPEAERLARRFWPGPLTIVLPRTPLVGDLVTGGGDTVGLRVPDHPIALDLLDAFGGALATPSANTTGQPPPVTAAEVIADLGNAVDLVLDGGRCAIGVASTVLSLVDPPHLVREGALPREALEAILGRPILPAETGRGGSPG